MLRLRFYRAILLTLMNSAILVLANPGRNWKSIQMIDVDIEEMGKEVSEETYFEVRNSDGMSKAIGLAVLKSDISPTTKVKWGAMYMDPNDNQWKTQAQSEPSTICDFMVFQSAVAQMFFENSNMTKCPFEKGRYVFDGSAPNEKAFPAKIPEGRDSWKVNVHVTQDDRTVARMCITAEIKR